MSNHADGKTDPAHERCEDQGGHHADREDQVLTDDSAGPPAKSDGMGEVRKVFPHHDHVGGFECDVRTGQAHGDSHVSRSQGRGVVDPIACHGDMVTFVL